MNINMNGTITTPIDYLQVLDDSDRRIFFFALDYITDHAIHHGELPPKNILDSLTSKKQITDYVAAYVQREDKDTLRKKVVALQAWKPLFLAVPPGQATGHRISAPGPVRKTDAPLSGAALLDGRAAQWNVRLQEKSNRYYSETSSPLILNYYEARHIRAEYASLEFKSVPLERGSGFPNSIEEQQKLVGKLYDAILNMDDILEKKRPISLKKSGSDAHSGHDNNDTSGPTAPRKRTATERDDGAGDSGDTVEADAQPKRTNSPPRPVPMPKETISVVKVKSLSRIEVEMLCWEILHTIRDVDRGQLPFMSWSGRDWGWDSQFATFHDRFEAVTTTLRRSKAAVCSLLESDYMARLAAHPRREYRRKENNRSQNAERNAQVFVGRHAIGTGQVQVGTTGDLQDRDGNVVAAAGTVHNGLIEQTRKLGEMGRWDSTTKRTKTTTGYAVLSTENTTTADATAAIATERSPTKPAQRKPRIRKRKLAAKTEPTTAEATTDAATGAVVAGTVLQDQEQNTIPNLEKTTAGQTVTTNVGQAGFIPAPSTPFSWSRGNSGGMTAVATPITPFGASAAWPPAYRGSMSSGQYFQPGIIDSCPGFGVNTPFVHTGGSNIGANDFPSVVSSFAVLNTDAKLNPLSMTGASTFTLPIRPATRTNYRSADANIGGNNNANQDSPLMVSDAPMEDIFSMEIAINNDNSNGDAATGNHIGNATNNQTMDILRQTATEQAGLGSMAPQWGTDEHTSLIYQLSLYNDATQNVLGGNYAPAPAPTSAQAIGDGLGLDMSIYNIAADLWATWCDSDSAEFGDDGSSTHADNGGF